MYSVHRIGPSLLGASLIIAVLPGCGSKGSPASDSASASSAASATGAAGSATGASKTTAAPVADAPSVETVCNYITKLDNADEPMSDTEKKQSTKDCVDAHKDLPTLSATLWSAYAKCTLAAKKADALEPCMDKLEADMDKLDGTAPKSIPKKRVPKAK